MIKRTNSQDSDFISLVTKLDKELAMRDGDDHSFFAQFNKIDKINHVVIIFNNNLPVGCGAIKHYEFGVMEIKRMFVLPEYRGKGIASKILLELENWTKEIGYMKCILETGKRQPEAISLYKKCNYEIIPNYGQYINIENSVCFQKVLLP
jgi:GNAT superfamily N-acetyltransferase